jgi:hypothetical protein
VHVPRVEDNWSDGRRFGGGECTVQGGTVFKYGKLDVSGSFGFATSVNISRISFLGVNSLPKEVIVEQARRWFRMIRRTKCWMSGSGNVL